MPAAGPGGDADRPQEEAAGGGGVVLRNQRVLALEVEPSPSGLSEGEVPPPPSGGGGRASGSSRLRACGAACWRYAAKLGEHPKGLWILVFTEVWERFSYYGMRALLVLYMNHELFAKGQWQSVWGIKAFTNAYGTPADDLPDAERQQIIMEFSSSVYGLYTALVYLTPLPGGFVSDQ